MKQESFKGLNGVKEVDKWMEVGGWGEVWESSWIKVRLLLDISSTSNLVRVSGSPRPWRIPWCVVLHLRRAQGK